MNFYLGAHHPHWLERASFPLFVSHRPLATRRRLPRARTAWALDSGGFTELSLHGRWETTPVEYVAAVRRYRDEIGNLEWAAPGRDRSDDAGAARSAAASPPSRRSRRACSHRHPASL